MFQANQAEHAKGFLLRMPGVGAEVRPHYFWPLFASYGKQGDIRNVFDLIATMNETNVSVTLETLTDFILPALKGLSTEEIVDQLRIRFPGMSIITPMTAYLVEHNNLQEATKFLQNKDDADINPQVISRVLAGLWIGTRDFSSVSGVLKRLAKISSKSQNDSFDAVGNFVLRVLTASKGDEVVLEECLKALVKDSFKMSPNAGNFIEARFQGRLPEKIGTLLDQVVGMNVGGQRFDDEFDKHPRNMTVEELEGHLQVRDDFLCDDNIHGHEGIYDRNITIPDVACFSGCFAGTNQQEYEHAGRSAAFVSGARSFAQCETGRRDQGTAGRRQF